MTQLAPVRILTAALACALTVVCALVGLTTPAQARAADRSTPARSTASAGPLVVSLMKTAPETLTKGSGLTATAQVRNTGKSTVQGARATLTLGTRPLDSLDAQQNWLDGEGSAPAAKTVTAAVPDIPAGGSATVELDLASSDLDLTYTMATLPLRVDVSDGGVAAPQSVRSFATWSAPDTTFTKMTASIVVPVVMPDDPKLLTATGRERFDAWNKAIGPNSPIRRLLASKPSVPVTWLVDPALLDPPAAQDSTLPDPDAKASDDDSTASPSASPTSTPSGASAGAGSTGTTSPGAGTPTTASASASAGSPDSSTSSTPATGSPASGSPSTDPTSSESSTTSAPTGTATTVEDLAAQLQQQLADRPSTQQVMFTPYADPDLSALTASNRPAGSDEVLARALARPLGQNAASLSNAVVAAPAAPLDAPSAARLAAAWKKARGSEPTVITANASLDGSDGIAVTSAARRTSNGLPVIGYTSALSRALADPSLTDTEASASARAASLAIYQQQPTTTRSLAVMGPRTLLSPSRLAQVSNALKNAAWVEPAALDVSAAASAKARGHFPARAASATGLYPAAGPRGFDAGDLASTAHDVTQLSSVAKIVADGSTIVPQWTRNLDAVTSTHWRGHASTVGAVVANARERVAAIPGLVSVVPSRINFFSDSGTISIAVKNDLARDVSGVTMQLTPRTYAVAFRRQPGVITIPARSQTTVRVPTVAQAASRVAVDASLTAPDGLTLGDTTRRTSPIEINARPTGTWIFWVLGIVALLVFCYGLVRRRQKGTRRRGELARDIQL